MDRIRTTSSSSNNNNNNCWRTEPAAPLPRSIFAVDDEKDATKERPPPTPVALVQAHDCYCVCLRYDDDDDDNDDDPEGSSSNHYYYRLAVWRKEDAESVIYLHATFYGGPPPLLQIAKAPQEHSCWFIYAIDNNNNRHHRSRRHASHHHQQQQQHQGQNDRQEQRHPPRLMAWEITYRSFLVPATAADDDNNNNIGAVATASRPFPPSIPPHRAMDVWPAGLWSDKQPRGDFDITSLSVFQPDYTPKPMLLLGTAGGTVLWSTQISVPMDFTIRKMVDQKKSSKPLLDRFKYQPPDTSIVAVIPLLSPTITDSTSTTFVVVQSSGKLVFWEMQQLRQYQFQSSAAAAVADEWIFKDKLREYFANQSTSDDHLLLYDMQVQAAVASLASPLSTSSAPAPADGSKDGINSNNNNNNALVIILLCNVQHSNIDDVDDQQQQQRQYWVVVQGRAILAVLPLRPTDRVTDCVMGTDGTPYMIVEEEENGHNDDRDDESRQQTLMTLCRTQSVSSSSSAPAISMAFQTLPTTPQRPYRGTLCPDHTTHGVLWLPRQLPSLQRARFLAPFLDDGHSGTHPIVFDIVPPMDTSTHREMEVLRSLFETWYTTSTHPLGSGGRTGDGPAAVSVMVRNPHVHAAVLPLAKAVSRSVRNNPMEQHLSYVQFLQTVGLYKYLSETTKWSLLAMGQAHEVVKQVNALTTARLGIGQQQQLPPITTSETIGEVLLWTQQEHSGRVIGDGQNDPTGLWLEYLHTALQAAHDHRQTYAAPRSAGLLSYDIVDDPAARRAPPGVVWTASILPTVLAGQLSAWHALQPDGIPNVADPARYLDILQRILEAYRDYGDVRAYSDAARRVFAVVRSTFGQKCDPWLFGLCRDHAYYHGVLTIHAGYTPCVTYSLTAMTTAAATTEMTTAAALGPDIETGMPFKHYALKWLAEHDTAIGRAKKLHEEWPDEFYEVAETTPALKPFQWMVDLLRENHNKVAEDLLGQISAKTVDLELYSAGAVICAAFASNEMVILNDDPSNRERAKQRTKLIGKKQDLLRSLHRFHPKPEMFVTTKMALNRAMELIVNEKVKKKASDFVIALEICGTFETDDDAAAGAVMVWFRALLADKDKWLEWIDEEPDLTAAHIQEKIHETTMFGQLIELGQDIINENTAVSWSNATWDKLALLDDLFTHVQLRRLITAYCGSRLW